jgi:peptidoglycan/LPS O-acetylase OafA/YrhL
MKLPTSKERYRWLDITRGMAISWIFLVHFIERFMAGSMFANPHYNWPPLGDRIAQLAPLGVDGLSGVLINLLRYLGWLGDQGVQIFLVASGFALAMSALKSSADFSIRRFYLKRMAGIFPLWIAVHLLFISTFILLDKGLSITDWRTWASLFGLRFLPKVMYYTFPAWWYIGVLIQLYAVFPLLFIILRRWSPLKFIIIIGGGAVLIRLAGLYTFGQHLDWWSRGAFLVARLPEFAFGMAFAKWLMMATPEKTKRLKSPVSIASIVGIYLLGNICSFFLAGMSVAFLLTGAGFFLLIWALFSLNDATWTHPLAWAGRRSYALFLFHHPVIVFLVPTTLAVDATGKIAFFLLITMAISITGAILLENFTNYIVALHSRWKQDAGYGGAAVRWSVIVGLIITLPIAAEAIVRLVDPQEVLGWGERPSLEPHDTYGYRLKPNKSTRLRWMSYDYIVEANALGFPGKLYEKHKPENVYRIMVTGDAFESAEGVDTKDAWPRLIEKQLLKEAGVETQVLNFSITGWGPNQYASVIDDYAPEYEPDLIIVGFFVNDFFDVGLNGDQYRRSIGFQKGSQTSAQSYICLVHLRSWITANITIPLREMIKNKPNPIGYFFGYFSALEKKRLPSMTANADLVEDRLRKIKQTAQLIKSRLIVVLVPAAVQVCGRDTLKYYPKGIDLQDSHRFDLDQPQRLAMQLCKKLSIPFTDLREPLQKAVEKIPYQPRNMHLTKVGHDVVAQYITKYLIEYRYLDFHEPFNAYTQNVQETVKTVTH